jgi:hypothetical protein
VNRSYSTRLTEVQNAGQADEHELPVDDAHGYLWRLYSYWRFEEKDGGVYVQLESIGLSRAVPAIIGWLVNPLLSSIPRGILSSLLGATRAAVAKTGAKASLLFETGSEPLGIAPGSRATRKLMPTDANRRFHNFAPFVRQTGEGKAQTCAMAMLRR